MSIQEQMKLDMVKNLALLLLNDNPQLSLEQALADVINSDTYLRLMRESTHLYYQSPRYVSSFLQAEINASNNNKQSVC